MRIVQNNINIIKYLRSKYRNKDVFTIKNDTFTIFFSIKQNFYNWFRRYEKHKLTQTYTPLWKNILPTEAKFLALLTRNYNTW